MKGQINATRAKLGNAIGAAKRQGAAAAGRPGNAAARPFSPAEADLADPRVLRDPFPTYEALRAFGPVVYLPRQDFWIVLGHDEMREVFSRPDLYSNAPSEEADSVLIAADPPRHGEVRQIITRRFTTEAVNRVVKRAADVAAGLIAPRFDAVKGFAAPVSRAAAAELIGLDDTAVAEIVEAIEAAQSAPRPFKAIVSALDSVADRAKVFDVLLEDGAGRLQAWEARSLVRFLWLASTTTTERVLARAIIRLLADPGLNARVRGDSSLVAPFIEEVMRLHSPEHMIPRQARKTVILGGVEIPDGALIQLCFSAANRDPAKFEDPAELRLDRVPNGHISFGSGTHVCSGAALSRRLLPVVLQTLLDRAPGLRAAQALDSISYLRTVQTLAPTSLMVES